MAKLRLVDNTGCIRYVYLEDLTQFENNLNLDWDYNGGQGGKNKINIFRKDWNQSLFTKINQISAYIHKNSNGIGGANKLFIHSGLRPLINTLKYTQTDGIGNIQLAGRYVVEFDDNLNLDEIIVTHEMDPSQFSGNKILLPELRVIREHLSMVFQAYDINSDADYINQKLRKYTGVINILNYPDAVEYNRVSKEIIDIIESTLENE